jgi:Protein of unknown function (DUF973)
MGPVMGPPIPTPATRAIDDSALTDTLWAAILWLVSAGVSLAALFVPGLLLGVTTTPTGSSLVIRWEFIVLVVVGGALSVVEVLLLRWAFHRLAPVDARFSTPATLSLVMLIGIPFTLAATIPLFLGVESFATCVNQTMNQGNVPACPGALTIIVGAIAVLIGAIILLVGLIGVLVGLWRLGTRYNNDLFHVGAILLIIPVLSVVGAILILVAAHSVREHLRRGPAGPLLGPSF